MKTLDEAFDVLLDITGNEFVPTTAAQRYESIGVEVLDSLRANALAIGVVGAINRGEVTVLNALRYAFGQGVLTGIEMEKAE